METILLVHNKNEKYFLKSCKLLEIKIINEHQIQSSDLNNSFKEITISCKEAKDLFYLGMQFQIEKNYNN